MKKMCRFFFLSLLLCSVFFSACQGQEKEQGSRAENTQAATVTLTPGQQQVIGLTTAQAVVREVRPAIKSFGRVIPRLHGRVQVTSPVAGRVTPQSVELIPSPGAFVRQEQLLAEVEQTYTALEQVQLDVGRKEATGTVREAKAALDAAEAEYQRSQNLFRAKIVSRKRLEEAQAAWLQAQSRYETARRWEASYRAATAAGGESPRRFPLTAPIEGVIVQAQITAGQQVDTATPLFIIADLSTVWVEAPIFEGDLDKIDEESPVPIHGVDGSPPWTGKPIYTGAVIDPLKRTANLLYEVNNSDGRLKLGMSVTIEVPTGPKKRAVMVPEAAVIESAGGKGLVYVRRSPTRFAQEEVTVGVRQDSLIAVEGAVREGEEVVVVGALELFGQAAGHSLAVGEE